MNMDNPLRLAIQKENCPPAERRQRRDRRTAHLGPPANMPDRRRATERRAMVIQEIELSDTQWALYFPQARQRWLAC